MAVKEEKKTAASGVTCDEALVEREKLGQSSFRGEAGDDIIYLSGKTLLNATEAAKYSTDYGIKYFFYAPKTTAAGWNTGKDVPTSITVHDIHTVPLEDLTTFVKRSYYDVFPLDQTENDFQIFKETLPHYFASAPMLRGRAYRKHGEIVAILFTHRYDEHPALKKPTIHIGYWGYERARVTQDEARAIKDDWFNLLSQYVGDAEGVDASVDHFNPPAARMVQSKGFEIEAIRLDRRGE